MRILGISCYYHDSAAALVVEGKIIAAAHEERFSRIKGEEKFPAEAIAYCLNQGGITLGEIDEIVFYEKPLLKFERILETYINVAPRGLISFLTALPSWLQKKMNHKKMLKKEFLKKFNFSPKEIFFCEHHLSHAASAFFPSPFEKAAVLCMDGVGEWATTTAWVGENEKLTPIWEIKFPHSLGLLYSAFTHYCGFKINSGEYKLMGLAPFGKPIYVELIKKNLIHLNLDGGYWINTSFFGFLDSLEATNSKFENLFGKKCREPESPLDDFYKDISASIQIVLNEAVLNLAQRIKNDTGLEQLCLAGGVALNCVANGLLAGNNIFKDIWIQPAAGDAGGALGCALALYYLKNKRHRACEHADSMNGAYLGPSYSDEQIELTLKQNRLKYYKKENQEFIEEAANFLVKNKIIGWFQGRMEYGPRALGARSILGNPLDINMKSVMNLKIKFREGFRPFAPIVTEKDYGRYFSLNLKNEYMLFVSDVKNTSLMPAITHIDGTARVQTIYESKNPKLHRLLEAFGRKSGHPVLINTSFNIRSEPIVCKPQDAVECFLNTDIDILIIEDFIVRKVDNLQIKRDALWREKFNLD